MEVAENLGHIDVSLVRQVCGHLMPDRKDMTRQAIDAAWVTGGSHGSATRS